MSDETSVEPNEFLSKMEDLTLQEEGMAVKIKRPKRLLHFSDGVVEEFSSDDEKENEDAVDNDDTNKVVDEVIFHVYIFVRAFQCKREICPWNTCVMREKCWFWLRCFVRVNCTGDHGCRSRRGKRVARCWLVAIMLVKRWPRFWV